MRTQTLCCLSVVAPGGHRIAHGRKTLEIRSWLPPKLPMRDLLIVENENYLHEEGDEDPGGRAVALVDIAAAHAWREDETAAACASRWEPGYHAWEIRNVRPIDPPFPAVARRKIYELTLDAAALPGCTSRRSASR